MHGKASRSKFAKLVRASVIWAVVAGVTTRATPPLWWSQGTPPVLGEAEAENRGLANVGQGKWMAQSALAALSDRLGSSSAVVLAIKADLYVDDPTLDPWEQGYVKYGVFNERYTPGEAATEITDADLRAKPFHRPFLYRELYDPVLGSDAAGITSNRYRLLGSGIPATSYAIAANSVPLLDALQGNDDERNFDMPATLKSPAGFLSWPPHENADHPADWMHSDFKDVSLHFLHPLYDKIIDIAGLSLD